MINFRLPPGSGKLPSSQWVLFGSLPHLVELIPTQGLSISVFPRLSQSYNSFMLHHSVLATFWNTFLEKQWKEILLWCQAKLDTISCLYHILTMFPQHGKQNNVNIRSKFSGVRLAGLGSCIEGPFVGQIILLLSVSVFVSLNGDNRAHPAGLQWRLNYMIMWDAHDSTSHIVSTFPGFSFLTKIEYQAYLICLMQGLNKLLQVKNKQTKTSALYLVH